MPIYFAELGFLRQPGSKYSVARNGLAKYDEAWLGTPSGSFVITQGAVSDRHPQCVLLEWDVSIADGCKLLINLHFEGVDDESMKDQIFDSATTTEPIDTHPRFGEIVAASGTSTTNSNPRSSGEIGRSIAHLSGSLDRAKTFRRSTVASSPSSGGI